MPSPIRFAALLLALFATPLAARNTTAPGPPPAPPVQPPAVTPPGTTPLPPGPVTPPPETAPAPANNAATAPPPPTPAPAPEPITIDPDAAYPNGFADPPNPFANDLSQAQRESSGFPWGLLGLFGLLGLIPLIVRRGGRTRTVYVDRNDPKRVIREEVEE